eukprot:SAG31_NODE_11102_length_1066_cov_1.138573_1_plen_187_part_00
MTDSVAASHAARRAEVRRRESARARENLRSARSRSGRDVGGPSELSASRPGSDDTTKCRKHRTPTLGPSSAHAHTKLAHAPAAAEKQKQAFHGDAAEALKTALSKRKGRICQLEDAIACLTRLADELKREVPDFEVNQVFRQTKHELELAWRELAMLQEASTEQPMQALAAASELKVASVSALLTA